MMQSTKTLFVTGRFDDGGGKPSKIGQQVFETIQTPGTDYLNGGNYIDLKEAVNAAKDYKLIYWFADVPNDKPKLVQRIKAINNECVLVTSKRNLEAKYSFSDLLYHALSIKSNLFVEFSKREEKYQGRIIDPLGNVFLDYTTDFSLVARVLKKRAFELLNYTRIASESIGEATEIPDEKEFFPIIKRYAEVFHSLIHSHPDSANRFFGNASFRCERGFPSFRNKGLIYVSRRNVDKRAIDRNAFVGVKPELPVKYYGYYKPSVDTPIQISIYNYYSQIRYILHSHVYVTDAPFTEHIIPCGAIEEADEIIMLLPNRTMTDFAVNLKGHGSLVLVDDAQKLRNINYQAREMPELVIGYLESNNF